MGDLQEMVIVVDKILYHIIFDLERKRFGRKGNPYSCGKLVLSF